MKVSVAYALLRKPLKDTLGYIEWLYCDKDEMINLLENGEPKDLQITKDKASKHIAQIKDEL